MLTHTLRTYPTLPSLPTRGPLPPMVGVVLPLARANLVTNPSIELATTGYTNTGNAIVRTATFQYHGTYSLQVEPTGTPNTGAYYAIALTAGVTYAVSCKMLCGEPTTGTTVPGKEMRLWVGDTSGNTLANTTVYSTGRWQWVTLVYHERIGATRRIYFTSGASAFGGNSLYIDGVQCEAISDGVLQATTYIDGDQLGLLPGQQPPAFGWNGTPHASTSYRLATTRAGGYVLNLREAYGFILTGLIGLGMAVPNNVSIPYSVLDGARYLRTTKPPRTLALPGRFWADTTDEQMRNQSAMRSALDRDAVPLQQPLLLYVEPQDECGNTIGDFATAQCLYAGGLEGNESNYPAEDVAPTFTMYVPYLYGGSGGAALVVQQSASGTRGIMQRTPSGQWTALGGGVTTGNPVNAILVARSGKIYVGGGFTQMGGVANTDGIAYYDPADGVWHAMGTGAAGGEVMSLTEGADGSIYAGGDFTSMDGVANTKCIARWDGGLTWNALGSGGGGSTTSVRSLAWNGAGTLLYVGGQFTDIGGSGADYLATWNGAAWAVVSSAAALNNIVRTVARQPGSALGMYIGGDFTNAAAIANADYIAAWSGSAYSALSTGMDSTVYAINVQPNGLVYIGGGFMVAGGVTVSRNAVWNGTGFAPIGTGVNAVIYAIADGPGSSLYMGGAFTSGGGLTFPDGFAIWTGSAFAYPDVLLSGGATVYALAVAPDGTVYVGSDGVSPITSSGIVTVENEQKQYVYPVITIRGPSSGTSRIYSLFNGTTGAYLFLNVTLAVGEIATLVTDPSRFSFTSNVRGDLSSTILPGSNPAQFYLSQGDNTITMLSASSSVVATIAWQKRYNGVADLVSP